MKGQAPASLDRLLEELERLPGIGARSAARIAHHLLRVPETEALALAAAIRDARERIRPCSSCRAPSEQDPCALCADPSRDRSVVMVLETPRDLAAVERAGAYRGSYYVLGGRLSPLEGVGTDALDLEGLVARARAPGVEEVCIATNPDLEGDGTALAVTAALKTLGVRVTRIARGVPTGGQIEYQNASALADAFEGRRPVA